jgi:AcrR family transcriptional regulator
MILKKENAMRDDAMRDDERDEGEDEIAARIARRTLAKRGAGYASEVRRLLDAGLDVMKACGTTSRPRVADIVAAAGLSNDAFYRHFPSKDALVAAIIEDGAERLRGYVAHQMAKETTAEGKVRRWVEGVLGQAADEEIAATTLAVVRNSDSVGEGVTGRPSTDGPLATLLREPFAELGSPNAELDAALAAHGVVGKLSDYLWGRVRPTQAEIDHIADFYLAAITPEARSTDRPSVAR